MPRTLRMSKPDNDVIRLQRSLLANGYFGDCTPAHGLFDKCTHDEVVLFQLQHIDRDGGLLKADGVVGRKTWWALDSPSGAPQRNHIALSAPGGLTDRRSHLLDLALEEHAKPVYETPDGSNRSPDIDRYWGPTGVIGKAWCCAFVSWALFETLDEYPIGGRHHLGVQAMWRNARTLGMQTGEPKPGDVFVQIKSGGKGHTGFVLGVTADGSDIFTVEGNCGNRVKIGRRSMDSIDHFVDCLRDDQDGGFERSAFDVGSVNANSDR